MGNHYWNYWDTQKGIVHKHLGNVYDGLYNFWSCWEI